MTTYNWKPCAVCKKDFLGKKATTCKDCLDSIRQRNKKYIKGGQNV